MDIDENIWYVIWKDKYNAIIYFTFDKLTFAVFFWHSVLCHWNL